MTKRQTIQNLLTPSEEPWGIRRRLLCSALELLQTRGYSALTQQRIAELAGVRQSNLTYYFPTRNDLLKAIVEEGSAAMMGMLKSEAVSGKPTLKKVRETMTSLVRNQGMPRLMIGLVVASDEDPSLRIWLQNFDKNILSNLDQTLRQVGLNPDPEALSLFHATMVGAAILSLQGNEAMTIAAAVKTIHLAFDRLVNDCAPPSTKLANT